MISSTKKATVNDLRMAGPLAIQSSPSRDIHLGHVESIESSVGSREERPASKKKSQINKRKDSHHVRSRPDPGTHNPHDPGVRISFKQSPKKFREGKKKNSPGPKNKVQQLQLVEPEKLDAPERLQTNQLATILSNHTDKPMIRQSHHTKDKSADSVHTHMVLGAGGVVAFAGRAPPGGHGRANHISDPVEASDTGAFLPWSQQGPPS